MDRNRERLVVWTIFPAVLLVYLCFPTKNYFFDGVDFAYTIESARRLSTSLVHPNHLIYNLVGYLVYKAVRTVGIETRALEVLRIANSLLGVLSAYILFRILRVFIRSLYLCAALVLLFSFSATWWKFSTDANAYIPSVLFILLSFYLALPTRKARPLLVALTFSLSMCFHQLAVVFYPVLVAALFLQADKADRRKQILNALYFSAAAFVITFVSYYYCFYLATAALDFTRFMRWVTSFSPDGGFSFSAWNNLAYTVRGHARLFFGGRFNLLRGLINPLIVVLMAALAAAVLLLIFQLIRNYKKPDSRRVHELVSDLRRQPVALLSALWVVVYLVFLFIWMPQHTFYRLFYLPAIIILAGLVLSFYETARAAAASHRRQYRLALLVAALSLANFLFLIYPYAHAEKFPPLAFALEMNREWPQGTVIYYALTNADNSLFRYFNPSTIWKQSDMNDRKALEAELQSLDGQGASAWLDDSAIAQLSSTTEGAEWLSRHAREETRRKLIDKSYRIQFVRIDPRAR
jgi:hypothetical protein